MLAFSLPLLVDRRGNATFSGIIVKLMKNRTASLPHATVLGHMRHLGHQLWDCNEKALLPVSFFQKYKLIISFPALCTFKSWKRQLLLYTLRSPLACEPGVSGV